VTNIRKRSVILFFWRCLISGFSHFVRPNIETVIYIASISVHGTLQQYTNSVCLLRDTSCEHWLTKALVWVTRYRGTVSNATQTTTMHYSTDIKCALPVALRNLPNCRLSVTLVARLLLSSAAQKLCRCVHSRLKLSVAVRETFGISHPKKKVRNNTTMHQLVTIFRETESDSINRGLAVFSCTLTYYDRE
jgi:hypothetical protein